MITHANPLNLSGNGAAYIRVSTDQQDTTRQYEAITAFEQRHGVTIPQSRRYVDEGWSRDMADKRPDFQRLWRDVEQGDIQWIVVDRQDRFGVADADEWGHYRYRLRKARCKLYQSDGTELTANNTATRIITGVEAERSEQEQIEKAHRNLAGKLPKAKAGEWQGGATRLGFDVVCYDRGTNEELWRVVYEGRDKRLRIWPDGRTERFDGQHNFPRKQLTEVFRLAPSQDPAKIEAAVSVFKRYATETISFAALARYLNLELGMQTAMGGDFQSRHVKQMLKDPIYRGFYSFNKWHVGRFRRFVNGEFVASDGYTENDPDDWILSERLFKPLVDEKTWNTVQRKLKSAPTKKIAPRSPKMYLSGLVVCGNCGRPMVGRSDRQEYYCATYGDHQRRGRLKDSPCMRNGVFQIDQRDHEGLETYINRWLNETGEKLDTLTGGTNAKAFTATMRRKMQGEFTAFLEALDRMGDYLEQHAPDRLEAAEQAAEVTDRHGNVIGYASHTYHAALIREYRRSFSADGLDGQIAALEAQHDELTDKALNVKTPRARDKVNQRLAKIEARIEHLERQKENLADQSERYLKTWRDYGKAIHRANKAMKGDELRRRAEALRNVIDRIECYFTATGKLESAGGDGIRGSRLVRVVIHPINGQPIEFSPGKTRMAQESHAQA